MLRAKLTLYLFCTCGVDGVVGGALLVAVSRNIQTQGRVSVKGQSIHPYSRGP